MRISNAAIVATSQSGVPFAQRYNGSASGPRSNETRQWCGKASLAFSPYASRPSGAGR
jgi:hypothetical protein